MMLRLAAAHGTLATVLCTVAAPSPAQDGALRPRHAVAGLVRTGDGRPVAGALVVLVGQVSPLDWAEPADRVAATSDADGCFRAMIRDCIEYAAWATADDPLGGTLASEIRASVTPGPRCELCLLPSASREFRIDGLDAFGGRRPTRARLWLPDAFGWSQAVEVGADHRIRLPRDWPAAGGAIELLQDDGGMVAVARTAADATSLALSPPREVDVVVELPDGTPAAAAEIVQTLFLPLPIGQLGSASRYLEATVGRTDGSGHAHLALCQPWGQGEPAGKDLLLRASKPGFAPTWSGFDHEARPFADGLPDRATAGAALPLRLAPATPCGGRLRLGNAPIAGCRLRVELRHVAHHSNGGFQRERAIVTTTDAEGAFALDGVDARDEIAAVLVDETALRAIAGAHGITRSLPPGQPFLFPGRGRSALDLDLASVAVVALELFTTDAGPASGAEVLAMCIGDEADYPSARDPHFRADNAGRATILLQQGKWFVLALDGTRAAWLTIDAGDRKQVVHLELAELPRVRGIAVDTRGNPVAGARMAWAKYGFQDARDRPKALSMASSALLKRWMRTVVTAADGCFALPMLAGDGTDFTVYLTANGAQSLQWQLRPTDEPLRVVLQ